MKKVLEFIKKVYNMVKEWIKANGVEGVLGLIVGLVLWIMNFKIWAGFCFGVFATRNWDIVKAWISSKLNK